MKPKQSELFPAPYNTNAKYSEETAPIFRLRNRAMVVLHDGGFTMTDIATLFGINRTTVMSIIHRLHRQEMEREQFSFLGKNVPIRIRSLCRDRNITSLTELQMLSEAELLREPNFGKKSLSWLKEHDFYPAPKFSGPDRVG